MSETITKQAEAISVAASTVRELARVAEVLASDAKSLVELAGKAVDDVHSTSLGDDYQETVRAADARISAADAAEQKLAEAQQRFDAREASIASRETAADQREQELMKRSDDLDAREQKLAASDAAKVEADGSKQPE